MTNRKVTRVLVMIEYGPEDPDSGEVYDLTALAKELHKKGESYNAHIDLCVQSDRDYSVRGVGGYEQKTSIGWRGYGAGGFTGSSGHLTDVMNAALPDNERVTGLKKKSEKYRKKADQLDFEARMAKIDQVSEVRHQHPIARVTESMPALGTAEDDN